MGASTAAADAPPARHALVVAMATYKALPPLPQCPIAARNIAAALRDAGFQVTQALDVTNGAMNAALAGFAQKAPPKAILVAYYCGYAAAFNGRGFLVPVSAELATADRIMVEGVAAAALVNVLGRADPEAALAIVDVAPAPGKSEPMSEAALAQVNPPPATTMLAISQVVPGGPGNALAERLRMPVVNLRALVERARDDWKGQLGTMLALTAPPAADVYLRGAPPPEIATTAAAGAETPDVESQMSEPERRRVQTRLRALGYYPGAIDGIFGGQTRAAIRRYQAAGGLPPSGRLGVSEATRLLFFEAKRPAP